MSFAINNEMQKLMFLVEFHIDNDSERHTFCIFIFFMHLSTLAQNQVGGIRAEEERESKKVAWTTDIIRQNPK